MIFYISILIILILWGVAELILGLGVMKLKDGPPSFLAGNYT